MEKHQFKTVKEVAVILKTNERAVRSLIKSKQLKAYKILNKYFIFLSDIEKLIKSGK